MRVTDLSGTTDVEGSDWDLAKDNAYVGFRVLYCDPESWLRTNVLWLIKQKGFAVTESCNAAGLLEYPYYAAFMIVDVWNSFRITAADAQKIASFYIKGGGLYAE